MPPRRTLLQTFFVGLLALLPLALTLAAIGWLVNLFLTFVGTDSFVGRLLVRLGLPFFGSPIVAYLIGVAMVAAAIYLLGLLVRWSFVNRVGALIDRAIRKTPIVGMIYDLAARLVGMLDTDRDPALQSMIPAWCFLGGKPGTAVLGLMPSREPVTIGDDDYLGILVPTAPVPFGGALLYVPTDWIEPAEIGIEGLTSIYATMGVTTRTIVMKPADAKAAKADADAVRGRADR